MKQPILAAALALASFAISGAPPAAAPAAAQTSADGVPEPTSSAQLGALMLAARLHRRRNSLGGLEPLADGGAAYVARTDPDISRLLGLDGYAAPTTG